MCWLHVDFHTNNKNKQTQNMPLAQQTSALNMYVLWKVKCNLASDFRKGAITLGEFQRQIS